MEKAAVSLFFGSCAFMYLKASSAAFLDEQNISSLFYTNVVAMMNPLIFSLRNKDIPLEKNGFWKCLFCGRIHSVGLTDHIDLQLPLFYLFLGMYMFFFAISEIYMLTSMAYDHYMAICKPLLYHVAMSP
ncbi:hypothetical protein Celaphus_00013530, partial [Cervus elaphus hippelaphus]